MSYKVLVVDDSKLARIVIAKALREICPDWVRVEATSADEGLALAKQSPVDLALLDFNMPGRDGLALAAELRQLNPSMPLAVISANQQEEVVSRARSLSAAFLPKPVSEQLLRDFLTGAERQLQAASG